jgi:hypothetical protein
MVLRHQLPVFSSIRVNRYNRFIDGYCGEVFMMQAGLINGQWMSQFNARLISGTGFIPVGTRWRVRHSQ